MPFTINQKHQIPRNKSNKRYSQDLCPEIYITFLRDIKEDLDKLEIQHVHWLEDNIMKIKSKRDFSSKWFMDSI